MYITQMQNNSAEINFIMVTKTLNLHWIKEWNSISVDVQSTPGIEANKTIYIIKWCTGLRNAMIRHPSLITVRIEMWCCLELNESYWIYYTYHKRNRYNSQLKFYITCQTIKNKPKQKTRTHTQSQYLCNISFFFLSEVWNCFRVLVKNIKCNGYLIFNPSTVYRSCVVEPASHSPLTTPT